LGTPGRLSLAVKVIGRGDLMLVSYPVGDEFGKKSRSSWPPPLRCGRSSSLRSLRRWPIPPRLWLRCPPRSGLSGPKKDWWISSPTTGTPPSSPAAEGPAATPRGRSNGGLGGRLGRDAAGPGKDPQHCQHHLAPQIWIHCSGLLISLFQRKSTKYRISKSETNSKFKCSKTANQEETFEFGTFGFVSNFGFRASNLELAHFIESFDTISRTT